MTKRDEYLALIRGEPTEGQSVFPSHPDAFCRTVQQYNLWKIRIRLQGPCRKQYPGNGIF